ADADGRSPVVSHPGREHEQHARAGGRLPYWMEQQRRCFHRQREQECEQDRGRGNEQTQSKFARVHQRAPMRRATLRSTRATSAIKPEESTAEATSAAQSCTVCP